MKRSRMLVSGWIVASSLAVASGETRATHWPQFRGPDGQGVSVEKGLPDDWSATRNILWKTAIPGRGYSSPVIWGDRIFLTTAIEGELVPGAKGVLRRRPPGRSCGGRRGWRATRCRHR